MFGRLYRISQNEEAFQWLTNNSMRYGGKFEKTKKCSEVKFYSLETLNSTMAK